MASIRTVKKDGIEYLLANNFMLGNNFVAEDAFHIRYKSPRGKIYEDKVVRYLDEDNDHRKAVHELWYLLHRIMEKAKPNDDINPFKLMNKPQFRQKVRLESEPPQMRLELASRIDLIASNLEKAGRFKEAYQLDIIANTIEAQWESNDATVFFDEIANQDIKAEDAKKIIDAYEKGADTEHSVAEVTGIDSWTCKKVLDIAHEHDLLNITKNKS